jgi:ribonucleotide monophosphatase NagD (HAD superfamily)
MGIETSPDDLITSALAAARLVDPAETALVCGGPGVDEALRARGVRTVRSGDADAVVVGWHRDFTYERLHAAFDAVRRGARLIGTNDDATYPTPDGPLPGGGSILAAVAYASGVTPTVAGKPFPPIVELLHERVADAEIMVGDRPSTDGLLARRLGIPFGLVLSGVTAEDVVVEPKPEYVATHLASLVAQLA